MIVRMTHRGVVLGGIPPSVGRFGMAVAALVLPLLVVDALSYLQVLGISRFVKLLAVVGSVTAGVALVVYLIVSIRAARLRVTVDGDGIEGPGALLGRMRIAWRDVVDVDYETGEGSAGCLVIREAGSMCQIRIPDFIPHADLKRAIERWGPPGFYARFFEQTLP